MPNRKVYGKQKDSMAKQLYDEHSLTAPSSKRNASLSGSKLAHHDRNLTSPVPFASSPLRPPPLPPPPLPPPPLPHPPSPLPPSYLPPPPRHLCGWIRSSLCYRRLQLATSPTTRRPKPSWPRSACLERPCSRPLCLHCAVRTCRRVRLTVGSRGMGVRRVIRRISDSLGWNPPLESYYRVPG